MLSPDPIHACWEGSQVIDSDFVWPAQYFQCLREVLCDPMFGDTGDPMFGDTGDPTCFLCGRCSILDGSEKFLVYTFCLCGRCNIILETSEKVTVTLREVPRDTSSVLWQVPSLPPSSSAWPYTFSLCGRRNIFRCFRTFFVIPPPFCVAGANHWRQWWPYFLFVWQVQYFRCLGEVSRDPISILCGRCTSNPASEKYFVTPRSFCVAGAICSMSEKFSWPGPRGRLWPHLLFLCGRCNIFWCLREVLLILPKVGCDPTSFLCGMCNNFAAFWPYPPPWKSRKWLTPCLREGPPGRLWVGSQATTTPHNSSDHVILRICFLRRHLIIFAWHGLCPASKV